MKQDLFLDVTEMKENRKITECCYKQNKHANSLVAQWSTGEAGVQQ